MGAYLKGASCNGLHINLLAQSVFYNLSIGCFTKPDLNLLVFT